MSFRDGKKHFDVIIIGGGPGGISAALWCAELGLNTVLFEKAAELGGQMLWTFNEIANYPGVKAANGQEMRDKFLDSIENRRVLVEVGKPVVKTDLTKKTVWLASGEKYSADAIIIATGVRRRRLHVPGELEFRGHGLLDTGAGSKDAVSGKTVVVVGGGDAAVENSLILSEYAEQVILVHRSSQLSARPEFSEPVYKTKNIEILLETAVQAIEGGETVEKVRLQKNSGEKLARNTDYILARIGVEPNTDLFRDQIALDPDGYIAVGRDCDTSVENVFAVGDITGKFHKSIANAVGQGAFVAKLIVDAEVRT